ncbi:MAG: DoxX family protein [Crocinitomicaceae bacterium]
MKYIATIAGKSMVFNIAFVLVNLIGLSFLVFANVKSSSESYVLFTALGLGLMILSIAGLVIFKGRMMISSVSRVLVGGLFIVSGLVKANDPLGFSYKLEEYFEDGALAYRIKELFGSPSFSLEFLMDSALVLSVIICIVEIVLGVLTIIGGKIKLVSYLLLGMMLFFTFLTWHTANCDPHAKFLDRDTYAMSDPIAAKKLKQAEEKKVTIVSQTSSELVVDEMKKTQCVDDCGCFGDALKGSVGRSLTPNESLWKDLILLYFVIWIFVAQRIIKPNTVQENLIYTISSMVVVVFFSWVFGWYFPVLFGLIAILGALWIRRIGGKFLGNYWGSALLITVLSVLLVTFVLMYSPIKDYRAYAVGSNLAEKMNNGVPSVSQRVMQYKNNQTGKTRTYLDSSNEYYDSEIWKEKEWEFVKWVEETLKEEIPASISDFDPFIKMEHLSDAERQLEFVQAKIIETKVKRIRLTTLEDQTTEEIALSEFNLETYPAEQYQILDTVETVEVSTDDIEIKEDILNQERIVLLVSRSLADANWNEMARIKEIATKCEKEGVPFILLANATRKEIDAFRKDNSFDCAIFSMDQIELKIISRSNPAILVLEKGVVKEKYSRRTIPTGKRFTEIHLKK